MKINIVSILIITFLGFTFDSVLANNVVEIILNEFFNFYLLVTIFSTVTRFGLNENLAFSVKLKRKVHFESLTINSFLFCYLICGSFLYIKFGPYFALLGLLWILSLNTIQCIQDIFKVVPNYVMANSGVILIRLLVLGLTILASSLTQISTKLLIELCVFAHISIASIFLFQAKINNFYHNFVFNKFDFNIFKINFSYAINNIANSFQAQIISFLILLGNQEDIVALVFAIKFLALGGMFNLFFEKSYLGIKKKNYIKTSIFFVLLLVIYYSIIIFSIPLISTNLLEYIYQEFAQDVEKFIYPIIIYSAVNSLILIITYQFLLKSNANALLLPNYFGLFLICLVAYFLKNFSFINLLYCATIIRIFFMGYLYYVLFLNHKNKSNG